MIIAKNLCKSFPNNINAVNNLSFHISKGETVGLIGANGAGKTTLIKLISGLLSPSEGFIRIFEQNPMKRNIDSGLRMGIVFGNLHSLQEDLTVRLNMELVKSIYRISDELYKSRLSRLCKTLDIESFIEYRVSQLSLGQRMRAEIASVLLYEPELLILDEPFVGVDVVAKESIRCLLNELSELNNTTVILTTHNVEEIERICSRVILLDRGNMIYNGSFDKIKNAHASINSLSVQLSDKIPDLQDMPIVRYIIENDRLTVWYDSRIIGSKDITGYLLSKCKVKDLIIRKPTIEEIIRKIYEENKDESDYN